MEQEIIDIAIAKVDHKLDEALDRLAGSPTAKHEDGVKAWRATAKLLKYAKLNPEWAKQAGVE